MDSYLVDCGDAKSVLSFLRTKSKILKGIFLTHCHYDHIYDLNDVLKWFPEATNSGVLKDLIRQYSYKLYSGHCIHD